MFVLACGVFVFLLMTDDDWWTDYWCWWLWSCELNLCCGLCFFFFFFWAFWLCDSLALWLSVTQSLGVCLWLSLLCYIDKRDRERVEFVEITLTVCLFFHLCWLVVGHDRDKWHCDRRKKKGKLRKKFVSSAE